MADKQTPTLKALIKRHLTWSDWVMIVMNIIPIYGVLQLGWQAKDIFLVYILESVIVGVFNVFQMWLTTLVKPKDEWSNGGASTLVSGYFFIFFFIIHYGFFVFIQMIFFFGAARYPGLGNGFSAPAKFLLHLPTYVQGYTRWLLIGFVISYFFGIIKDYVLSGKFRTQSLGVQMFSPYGRIFVQQFAVIIGSFLLLLDLGTVFIIVFVIVKIFFGILLNFEQIATQQNKEKNLSE
jgi:hypothetical protein